MSLWYSRKSSSHVQEKWFNEWYAAGIDYYHTYSYDIWDSWSIIIFFPNGYRVGGVKFPTNAISPDDPSIIAWEYWIVAYLMKIPDPKFPLFSRLTKFQQCMFKTIQLILTSSNGPTKIPYIRSLCVEVHCAIIEYENEKAKRGHYFVQLVDLDDPNDQWQNDFQNNKK